MLMWLDRVKSLHFPWHPEFSVKELVKQKGPGTWGSTRCPTGVPSVLPCRPCLSYAVIRSHIRFQAQLRCRLLCAAFPAVKPSTRLPPPLSVLILSSFHLPMCFALSLFPARMPTLRGEPVCLCSSSLGARLTPAPHPVPPCPLRPSIGLPTQCTLSRNTWVKTKARFSVKHYSYVCTRPESAHFFHKGHKGQMLWDSGPYGLCHSYSTLLFQHERNHR